MANVLCSTLTDAMLRKHFADLDQSLKEIAKFNRDMDRHYQKHTPTLRRKRRAKKGMR